MRRFLLIAVLAAVGLLYGRRPFLFQPVPCLAHLPRLPVALDVQARVLDAVHLFHVQHTVLQDGSLLVGGQGRTVVARPFIVLVI